MGETIDSQQNKIDELEKEIFMMKEKLSSQEKNLVEKDELINAQAKDLENLRDLLSRLDIPSSGEENSKILRGVMDLLRPYNTNPSKPGLPGGDKSDNECTEKCVKHRSAYQDARAASKPGAGSTASQAQTDDSEPSNPPSLR